jgi:hypothetical protein
MRGKLHLAQSKMQCGCERAHYLVVSFSICRKRVLQKKQEEESRPNTHISLLQEQTNVLRNQVLGTVYICDS